MCFRDIQVKLVAVVISRSCRRIREGFSSANDVVMAPFIEGPVVPMRHAIPLREPPLRDEVPFYARLAVPSSQHCLSKRKSDIFQKVYLPKIAVIRYCRRFFCRCFRKSLVKRIIVLKFAKRTRPTSKATSQGLLNGANLV